MNLKEAMLLSWEHLQLMAFAGRRRQAAHILDLAQTIVAGMGDKKAWAEKQKQLIQEIKSEA